MADNGWERARSIEKNSRKAKAAAKKAEIDDYLKHLADAHGCRTKEMGRSLSYLQAWHRVHEPKCTTAPGSRFCPGCSRETIKIKRAAVTGKPMRYCHECGWNENVKAENEAFESARRTVEIPDAEADEIARMTRIAGWETVRYGLPKKGEHYLVLDDEDVPADELPYVNQAAIDHDEDGKPAVIVRKLPEPCTHDESEERSMTFTYCGVCGEVKA